MKATSVLDVEVLLCETVGGVRTLNSLVNVAQEKGKPNALVSLRRYLRSDVWILIHNRVKEMGGRWSRKQRLWIVPLEKAEALDYTS